MASLRGDADFAVSGVLGDVVGFRCLLNFGNDLGVEADASIRASLHEKPSAATPRPRTRRMAHWTASACEARAFEDAPLAFRQAVRVDVAAVGVPKSERSAWPLLLSPESFSNELAKRLGPSFRYHHTWPNPHFHDIARPRAVLGPRDHARAHEALPAG